MGAEHIKQVVTIDIFLILRLYILQEIANVNPLEKLQSFFYSTMHTLLPTLSHRQRQSGQ